VSVWRHNVAFTAECPGDPYPALFLREGTRTRRLASDPGGFTLSYRAGTLAVILDTGLDTFFVQQWMANGESCVKRIDASGGDATDEAGWYPTDLWIANGYLIWTMGIFNLRPDFAILAAKVRPGCETPGPIGEFPFRPKTTKLRTMTVDSRRVFYADDKALRSHRLPAKPSFAPPPNDDFSDARELAGDAPLSSTGRVAYATVQADEPLSRTNHTVWWAYRPTTSGTVYVTVSPGCFTTPDNCGGLPQFGVYTGSGLGELEELRQSGGPYSPRYTRIDAVAGKTYWIAVGSPLPEPNYEPFDVQIDRHAPGELP
jgi:hypothetical protein